MRPTVIPDVSALADAALADAAKRAGLPPETMLAHARALADERGAPRVRRKPGPRRKPESEQREIEVRGVYVTADEDRRIRSLAAAQGLSRAEYLRRRALGD